MPAEGDSSPGTFSAFYIEQPDHQATEELSANLALQPSKTCFAGRDSAAEVRSVSAARILTILVFKIISCKTEVVSSCFLLVLKSLSSVSFPVWRLIGISVPSLAEVYRKLEQ